MPQAVKPAGAKPKPNAPQKAPMPKRRKKYSASAIISFIILFLTAYIIITLFIGILIMYSFNTWEKGDDIYSVNIVYDENVLHKISASRANNEYGMYVPFEYLAEISTLGLAGNGDDMTLFIIGTENRIKCTKNSSLVVINDNAVRISSPILYENGEYYIPVTLVENYINGIDVTYDDEDMVCTLSVGMSKSDIELNLLLPDPMDNAYFPESYKYYDDPNAPAVPQE